MHNRTWRVRRSLLVLMLAAVSCGAVTANAAQDIDTKEQPFTLKLGATRVIYSPESSGATLTVMNV
ncbi:hypothetical protein BL250_15665 [Erwinia sp. OLTSP20]|uniref:hypothetical protein n=1 Tax=unclassified Erwinia TaxID=2622719 RepID=UPI000C3EF92E|nr:MULTISPECIES: hypothetical protein [unclassified Erwinia]PIJ78755.1 hypothetical protein BLD47_16845 [Erwinia sp. OLCASP19]PIJ79415.1 hypothetical protein BLD46_17120 [Erwinia sp. OLMTSP26]PIJ81286.1 hypothetical protein BLD49_16515 [Erwinia sp. OLMDSP33]PIJ88756.1 hypothetical protein BL249_17640 [Erwinia sp. OLFS4]PIJ89452.1 hypothetical protein BL250_15665 [Erwinia sp. OLTSP20]